jgi:protein phosphatase PTC7
MKAHGFFKSSEKLVSQAFAIRCVNLYRYDVAFVEVEMNMVSGAGASSSSSASSAAARTSGNDGDMDYAGVDFERVKHYRVEVTTASIRGAGTSGSAELTFIGDRGVSPPIPLEYEADTSPGFVRGTTLPFRVTTYGDMGKLSQVQVRLIPEMSQVGHGWLLENVAVKCEETGDSWHFHSHKWFGQSDCGGMDG